ncbi:restriction endonuclease subunit S [Endozoicomonas sp. YOMI1]|uniref:restriction endonuclease subunit S n=1 Tax=Endozoicomonas sp. YOMI1 TaxID=2828739 RepID=UPI002148D825|nr:restriction endonuclease subunit S [Endozoicomonas sp. YOMI1]
MSDNWSSSKLGQLTAIAIGGTPSRDNSRYWASNTDNGFPWVSIADLNKRIIIGTKEQITQAGVLSSNVKLVRAGSVLMSFKLSLGKVAFAGTELYTNEAIASFTCSEELDEAFLFYTLPNLANSAITDVAIKGATLNKKSLHNLIIKYPHKKKQHKIATILSTIDTAIERTEALITKYQQIKAGLMHDLFTRGVLPNGQLRPSREQAPELYQETAIGWIPKDWKSLNLKEALAASGGYLQTGPFGSQLHAHEYQDEGIPVIMPQDINDGLIDTYEIARITEARASTLAKHRVQPGDIIIARRGELSRAAAITEQETSWLCGTGCFLLRLKKSELNHYFVASAYRHDIVQRQIAGLAVGSTMPSLNNEVMNKLVFPFPDPEEQHRIVLRIDISDQKIRGLYQQVMKLKNQKLGLMQDLLTGRVPVSVKEPEAPHG